MKEYKYKNRYNFDSSVSAQIVGERLEVLYKKHKCITPEIVLNDARNEDAELHPIFEWNDKKAAEHYRRDQARHLIKSLEITIGKKNHGGKIVADVRVYHNIRGEESIFEKANIYLTIEDAMSNPVAKDYLLKKAYADLVAFKKKYETLMELKPHIHLIDKIIDELKVEQEVAV